MIDIAQALYNVLHSRYGRDVRTSIHDAIYQINENANEAVQTAKAMGVGTVVNSTTSSTEGYVTGNLYLNNVTWDLWRCIGENSWQNMGNVKGARGDKGVDGTNYYIHIRYSQNYDGTDFTVSPTASSQFMGVYYGTSATAPNNKQDYQWVSYVGAAGTSAYVHIRYSEVADGSNFVSAPTANTKFIGIYTGSLSSAPANKSYYTWSKYVGDDGDGAGDMLKTEYAGSGVAGAVDNALNLKKSDGTTVSADDIAAKVTELGNGADDTDKVLTANGDGTTSWKPSKGGSVPEGNEDWLKSRNLCPNNIVKGLYIYGSGEFSDIYSNYVCNKGLIKVKPNTTYVISTNLDNDSTAEYTAVFYNASKGFAGNRENSKTFTTNANTEYVTLNVYRASGLVASDVSFIQLEEGSTATPYQSFNKSNAELTEIVEDSADWLKGKVLSYPTVTQGSITDSSALNRCSVNEFIAVEPNKNYIFTSNADVEFTVWYYENTTNDRIGASGWNGQNAFVTPSNCHYIKAMIRKAGDINIAPSDCGIVKFSVYYKSNVELTRELSNSFSQAELIGSSSTMEGAVYFNNETLNKYKEIILEVKHEIISGENARRGTILIVPTAYINLLDISLGTTFGDIGIPNGVAAMIYLDKNIGVTYWYAKINKSGASQNFTFSVYGIK